MNGVLIDLQFIPIKILWFSKWTGKPILNKKLSIPQGHNIGHGHNEKSPAR